MDPLTLLLERPRRRRAAAVALLTVMVTSLVVSAGTSGAAASTWPSCDGAPMLAEHHIGDDASVPGSWFSNGPVSYVVQAATHVVGTDHEVQAISWLSTESVASLQYTVTDGQDWQRITIA